MTKYHPRNDLVLVLPDQAATHHGTIALPASAQQTPTIGTIVEVGPGILKDDGTYIPLDLQEHDRVQFTPDNKRPHFDMDGKQHLLMREGEILCKLSEEPQTEMRMPEPAPMQTLVVPGIPKTGAVGSPGTPS